MADPIPVIPTLSKGTEDILSSPEAVLWYLLDFSLRSPGQISEAYEQDLVSFRELEAQYGNDAETLAQRYAEALNGVVAKYYPNGDYTAETEIEEIDENKFTLKVGFFTSNGVPVLSYTPLTYRNGEWDLDLESIARK